MSQTQFTDYQIIEVRESAILTTSYVAGVVLDFLPGGNGSSQTQIEYNNQLVLYVDFTKGSLTTGEIKVEFSNDGTTYYQESSIAVSSGTATVSPVEYSLGASGNYRLAIPLRDRFIKISAKGTGTVTSSAMAISAILGVN